MTNKIFMWKSSGDGYGESSRIIFADNIDDATMLFRKSYEYQHIIHNMMPKDLMDELCGPAGNGKSFSDRYDLFQEKIDEMFSKGEYPSKDYFIIEELDATKGSVVEIGDYWE